MFDKKIFFTPLFSTCFWIRDPGSGMGKNQDPGSGINIPDPQHWLKYLSSLIRIRDEKNSESGMEKMRIRDKHPGSATLINRT
jgi:hypothetical protein